MNKKDEREQAIREIKKILPRVALFILLLIVLYFGFGQIVSSVIPDTSLIYDEDGDAMRANLQVASFLSLFGAGIIYFIYFRLKRKKNTYEKALLVMRGNDKNILNKLGENDPYEYSSTRDIALNMTLHSMGISIGYDEFCVVKNLFEYKGGRRHDALAELDRIFYELLPDTFQDKFPKEVYFIRVFLIRNVLRSGLAGIIFPGYDKYNTPKDEAHEFCKLVLNEYYKNAKDYKPLSVHYNAKRFEEYLKSKKG